MNKLVMLSAFVTITILIIWNVILSSRLMTLENYTEYMADYINEQTLAINNHTSALQYLLGQPIIITPDTKSDSISDSL